MPNHTIFNERPECQNRMLKMFPLMDYEFVSRADAEKKRGHKSRVVFEDELKKFLLKQRYEYKGQKLQFSLDSIEKAIRELDMPIIGGLSVANKRIYDLLCSGISLEQEIDGGKQSFDIKFIDFENIDNNIFQVTEEFEVERTNGKFARPDIVVLVNGIPIVVIECKKSSVDVMEGVKQNIRNWQPDYIPQLFKFTQVVIAVNPNKLLYGTCGTSAKHFVFWREDDKLWLEKQCQRFIPDGNVLEQDKAMISLLDRRRLMTFIRNYIIYDNHVKKIARYKQFFAVEKCMKRINGKDEAENRNGVVWHTQGSGKTLTMIMLVKMIQQDKKIVNPRFIMVTDRKGLDKQMRDNFISTNMSPIKASTGKGLVKLLKDKGNTVITTIINKFETAMKENFVDESDDIFLLIDEGHRSHYGKLNTYMTNTLPNAPKISFTGTPLLGKEKRNTYSKFGEKIDSYTIEDAVEDGVTVPIVYEGRVIEQKVKSDKINSHLEFITSTLSEKESEDLEKKWSRFIALAQTTDRINMVAFDLYEHFTRYVKPKRQKAMLTVSSRPYAVEMYNILKTFDNINPAVVITDGTNNEAGESDVTSEGLKKIDSYFKKEVEPLYGTNIDRYEEYVINTFKDQDGDIDLLIVVDKLLTGFDAPIASVLYIDKSIKEHSLLQAIARVNRLYEGKEFGLVVDYWGVFKKLNSALDLYSDTESGLDAYDNEDIKNAILGPEDEKRKLELAHADLWRVFDGIKPNETNSNIWQEHLGNSVDRNEFYEKLSKYSKCVDYMYSSYEFFKLVGYEKAEQYRKDLLHFAKLRGAVSLRYNDSVDFSKYEDGIRALLDTYVNAQDVKIIVEPLNILDKGKMDKQLEAFGDNKRAKADAISTRATAEISSFEYDDPIKFLLFSERIQKTLDDYLKDRNDEAYYNSMEDIADNIRKGHTTSSYPAVISNDSDAKSFYGSILKVVGEKTDLKVSLELEDKFAYLSIAIKETVKENAKRDWRNSKIVMDKIEGKLDDELFDFMEDNDLDFEDVVLDKILESIMVVAQKRF